MNALAKWTIGTVIAGVAVAATLVPKGQARFIGDYSGSSRYDTLYRAWSNERSKYSVMRRVVERGQARADARALPTARGDAPLFRFDPALGDDTRMLIEKRVNDELRGSRSLPTRYPIAVTAILDTTLRGAQYTHAVVLPERPGDPCAVVLRVPSAQRYRLLPSATHRLLSTCAFYAVFGQPGEGTQRWLVETRGVSARHLVRPSAFADDTGRMRLGVRYNGWDALTESLLHCRMGIPDACLRFLLPEATDAGYFAFAYDAPIDRSVLRTEFPGVMVTYSGNWMADAPRLRSALLAELAAEMGNERFTLLWRDPRGLQEAYQTSTGRSFADFVGGRVAARTLPYAAGPAIPALPVVLAFAIIAALAVTTIARSPRQMA